MPVLAPAFPMFPIRRQGNKISASGFFSAELDTVPRTLIGFRGLMVLQVFGRIMILRRPGAGIPQKLQGFG